MAKKIIKLFCVAVSINKFFKMHSLQLTFLNLLLLHFKDNKKIIEYFTSIRNCDNFSYIYMQFLSNFLVLQLLNETSLQLV